MKNNEWPIKFAAEHGHGEELAKLIEDSKTKPNIFVVYKEGIYGHGVWGVFNLLPEAIAAADKLAETDEDSWHQWKVFEVPVGVAFPFHMTRKQCESYDGYMNLQWSYSAKKGGTHLC